MICCFSEKWKNVSMISSERLLNGSDISQNNDHMFMLCRKSGSVLEESGCVAMTKPE